jgi:hypothetical protein
MKFTINTATWTDLGDTGLKARIEDGIGHVQLPDDEDGPGRVLRVDHWQPTRFSLHPRARAKMRARIEMVTVTPEGEGGEGAAGLQKVLPEVAWAGRTHPSAVIRSTLVIEDVPPLQLVCIRDTDDQLEVVKPDELRELVLGILFDREKPTREQLERDAEYLQALLVKLDAKLEQFRPPPLDKTPDIH